MKNEFEKIEEHLIYDDKPSVYLNNIINSLIGTPLEIFTKLKGTMQNLEFHPEGDAWNHTLEVVDVAAKIREFANDKSSFMIGAFMHDIGKVVTTRKNKKGRLTSYNHDTKGEEIVKSILDNYNIDDEKKRRIIALVKYHMHHIYIIKDLPFGDTKAMINNVDINDMILIFISDKLGRSIVEKDKKIKEIEDVKKIINKIKDDYNLELKDLDKLLDNVIKKI